MTIANIKREINRVAAAGGAFPADGALCAALKAFKESTGKTDREISDDLGNQISLSTINRCVNRAPAKPRIAIRLSRTRLPVQASAAIQVTPSVKAAPSAVCGRKTPIQACKELAQVVSASGGHITDRALGDIWGMSTSWANRHRK